MAWLPGAEVPSFAERAERAFREAQQSVRADRTNLTALIHLARSAFDRAEFARNNDERAEVATHGADAAREAIHLAPTNAAAHYWLAMNFGQLARTKTLGALHLVRRMEEEFLRARELDPRVDFAGPDRSLGLLYRDAPGWPTSVGNKRKARTHLENAIAVAPEFPDNQLALLETYDKWGEAQNFPAQLKRTEATLAAAKEKFTGPQWDSSWADWQARFEKQKAKGGR